VIEGQLFTLLCQLFRCVNILIIITSYLSSDPKIKWAQGEVRKAYFRGHD